MIRRTCLPLAAIGALASGCALDGDVDLSGSYLVRAAYGSPTCGTDAPITTSVMHLVFTDRLSSGFTYKRCMDAAETSCTGSYADVLDSFSERVDGGWRGTYVQAGPIDDTHCALESIVQTATLEDGHLVLDTRFSRTEIELPSSQCNESVATNNPALQCTMHERLEATKI